MNFRYASVANRTVRALNDRLFALFGVRLVRSSNLERMHVELRNLQKQRDASQLVSREVAGSWVLAELDDGTRLWVDLGDYGVSHACMFGTYEPVETGFVRSMLKSGQYFIDIGRKYWVVHNESSPELWGHQGEYTPSSHDRILASGCVCRSRRMVTAMSKFGRLHLG